MSDWQAGDLALCIRGGDLDCPLCGLTHNGVNAHKAGQSGVVKHVGCASDPRLGALPCDGVSLSFEDGKKGIPFRYIKITPPDADEWDRETIALMNGVRVGEPA